VGELERVLLAQPLTTAPVMQMEVREALLTMGVSELVVVVVVLAMMPQVVAVAMQWVVFITPVH
jgi:hypothetical protein